MSAPNERDILRHMRTLAATAPKPVETGRALRAVRFTLIRRRAMRWTTVAALAAALILVAAIFIARPRAATAAEALTQAAERSQGYKGWVQIKKFEQATSTAPLTPNSMTHFIHFNTETGVLAGETRDLHDDVLDANLQMPLEKMEVTYSQKTGAVKIGNLRPENVQNFPQVLPLNFAAAVAEHPEITVRESKDGELNRYDITFPKKEFAPNEEELRRMYPTSGVVWCDPRTMLISKTVVTLGSAVITEEWTYGGREIRDVYDLGVPRAARVVDLRPTADLSALLARLEKHNADGFGSFVAVETLTSEVRTDGTMKPGSAGGFVDGRTGTSEVTALFLFENPSNAGTRQLPTPPKGWPMPDIDEFLGDVQKRVPAFFVATDGRMIWTTNRNNGVASGISPEALRDMDQRMKEVSLRSSTLPARLWPTSQNLNLYGVDAHAELISDPTRPGLIGMRVEFAEHPSNSQKSVTVYWLDPAKDDLPVETLRQTFAPGNGPLQRETRTTYSDFARTQDDQWYPAAGKMEVRARDEKNVEQLQQSSEIHIQLHTGKTLGAEWFGDLSTHGTPATHPAQ